jgi:hypothetical protein
MAFPLSLKFHPQELEITRATWCRDTLSSGRVFLWSPSYRPLDRGAFDFSTRSSFPDQMEGDFASKRRPPMFEKIDPLPRPQGGPPQHDRDRQLRAGQGRADVGGHIVGALVDMPVSPCSLGRQSIEKRLQVSANVRRRVFLDEQSSGGVSAKQGQEPGLHPVWPEPIQDVLRNLDKPPPARRNLKNFCDLTHAGQDHAIPTRIAASERLGAPLGERTTWRKGDDAPYYSNHLDYFSARALPTWPYSSGWGYYPAGGVGTILIILLILALLGYV